MRILALRTHWFPDNTPGSRRFESILKGLSQANEVVLYAPTKNVANVECSFKFEEVTVPNFYFGSTYQKYVGRVRRFTPMLDYFVSFGKNVERAIDEAINRGEEFDCIVTTYQTMSSVEVASRLGKKYNIPWFCDVRDLPNQFLPLKQLNTESKYLYSLLKSAKGVSSVNRALCNRMAIECSITNAKVVYNGVPLELLNDYTKNIAKHASGNDFFDIVYAGSLYAGRKLDPLLDAVKGLSKNSKIRVIVLGSIKSTEQSRYLNKYGQIVEFKGLIPLSKLTSYYKQASVLVNLLPESHKDAIPSKIFEYAATGRAILNLSPIVSFVSEFLEANGFGKTMINQDECEQWLLERIADWEVKSLPIARTEALEKLMPFTREAQANSFEALITDSFLNEKV